MPQKTTTEPGPTPIAFKSISVNTFQPADIDFEASDIYTDLTDSSAKFANQAPALKAKF